MRYPNSEMFSTYEGDKEGSRHRCAVLLRDDSIVVEYVDDNIRTTYKGHLTAEGEYTLRLEEEGYTYSATLKRIDEDMLEGDWKENSGGTLSGGTWSIELVE